MNPRFYTNPPIVWPWLMVNIKQLAVLKKWNYNHCIVDCGIYDLLKPPYRHSDNKLRKWKSLEVKNGWKVVPDCPSLFYEHGIDTGYNNTDYSRELMELFDPEDSTQLPIIQLTIKKGSDSYKQSVREYTRWFKQEYGQHPIIGVGSVCKAGNKEMVHWIIKFLRKEFKDSWLHAFGLKMNHYPVVKHLIDSFDSMSWTFPRSHKYGRGIGSCKNGNERKQFFQDYVERLEELNGQRITDIFN